METFKLIARNLGLLKKRLLIISYFHVIIYEFVYSQRTITQSVSRLKKRISDNLHIFNTVTSGIAQKLTNDTFDTLI